MATNLTLKKSSLQLVKPATSGQAKPSLTNVAVCSGCHGCGGGMQSPIAPVINPATPMG